MSAQAPDRSLDAFQRGSFTLAQSRGGHRAGLDALLLAATAPPDGARDIADLGSGAGAVGLSIASRRPETRVTLIERDAVALADARATLALPDNATVRDRVELIEVDIALRGREREAAGLRANAFDAVYANPPFNLPSERASPDMRRAAAHVATEETFEAWLRTAADIARPGGALTMIARPENLPQLLAAWSGRFGGPTLRVAFIGPSPNAGRILLRGRKGSKNPLRIFPELRLRDRDGPTALGRSVTEGSALITM